MKRILATALLLAAAGAFALVAGGASGGSGSPRYWIELDNAFGLTGGADFKVAGVSAGKITQLKVAPRSHKALVQVELRPLPGVSPLKTDVTCQTRPQSLIGEYFIDCNPGRAAAKLKPGGTVPVTRTYSTIGPDLVNNILRLPQRDRLRIILNELGTTTAARGQDLNDAIRRGVPALRETDNLLAILARENQVIAELTTNADRVITALANNRRDVGRFVVEARDTAAATAERRVALAQTFARLPRFLEELRPTMLELGRTADAQTPALRDLSATSGQLTRFFNDLGPFANASRPAFRSLGDLSVVGRQAVDAARPTVRQLRQFTRNAPELGRNLAIVLEDLDNRDRAVEPDRRSPTGKGFTGLEALLNYTFWQSQAINIFDENGYILKVGISEDNCSPYRSAQTVRNDPALARQCASTLGPTQPGINAPDPSDMSSRPRAAAAAARTLAQRQRDAGILAASQRAGPVPAPGSSGSGGAPPAGSKPPIDLGRTIGSLLGGAPNLTNGAGSTPQAGAASGQAAGQLLDYILGS